MKLLHIRYDSVKYVKANLLKWLNWIYNLSVSSGQFNWVRGTLTFFLLQIHYNLLVKKSRTKLITHLGNMKDYFVKNLYSTLSEICALQKKKMNSEKYNNQDETVYLQFLSFFFLLYNFFIVAFLYTNKEYKWIFLFKKWYQWENVHLSNETSSGIELKYIWLCASMDAWL